MPLDKGLFVSDELHERKVVVNGTEVVLHIKQLPASEFRRYYKADGQDLSAAIIAACVCEPDGKPALTIKDALRLTTHAEKAIFDAIQSVNGVGDAGKASPSEGATDGSGTS